MLLQFVVAFGDFCARGLAVFRMAVAYLLIYSLLLQQFLFAYVSAARAADLPINPDGTTNTQVGKTASGIDQINIATPDSSGFSHNRFRDYNVNQSGQIINNFSGQENLAAGSQSGANAVTATQIGGLVTVNPNLHNSGSAKLILNEVTSNNTSRLLGYTEIAGAKADLIIANPNGITCNGCGFINSARLTMIAGKTDLTEFGNNGDLKFILTPNFLALTPLITIESLGLDATRNSATDIIASSIKLLGNISAAENSALNLLASDGAYIRAKEGKNEEIAAVNFTANSNSKSSQPENSALFAIDAANLSKIQAGRIYLIATNEGFGVNMAGEILARNSININSAGEISYNQIKAENQINIAAKGAITSQSANAKIAATNVNIKAAQINNSADISAVNAEFNEANLNNSGNIQALALIMNLQNLQNSGLIYGANSLQISGQNIFNQSAARILSEKSLKISANNLEAKENSVMAAINGDLTLNLQQNINNFGEISAQNNLTFVVANNLLNSGNVIAGNDVNFSADFLVNYGLVQSDGSSKFKLSSLVNQKNAVISAGNSSNLDIANNLQNFGELSASETLKVKSANFSNSGNIITNKDLDLLASSNFTNDGNIQTAQNLIITTANFYNSWLLQSLASSTINANEIANQNLGKILAVNDLILTAVDLQNFGKISAQNNFTANSSSLTNLGSIYSANNFSITSNADLTNSGIFYSDGNLAILSKNLTNSDLALIYADKDISITANSNLANSGDIQAINNLNLAVGKNGDNSGVIIGKQLEFTSFANIQNSGSFIGENNIILSAANFANLGLLQTLGEAEFNLSEGFTNQEKAIIYAGGNFRANSSSINNSGVISTLNSAAISAQSLSNSGEILANGNAAIKVSAITNSGVISTNEQLTISSSGDLTNSGNIFSNAALTVSANNLTNNSSAVIASLAASLSLEAANDFTNNGQVSSSNDISIAAKNLTNSGDFLAGAKLNAFASNQITNSGNFQSLSDSIITTANFDNSGAIKSFGASAITANSITNQTNAVIYSNLDAAIIAANSFTNRGSILSDDNLAINSASATNSGEIFANSDLYLSLTNSFTNQGSLSSVGNLAIKSNNSITNSNQILSNGDLTIAATNLTNSSAIQSNGNITLSLSNLTNLQNISANKNLAISSLISVANSGNLQSSEALSLDTNNLQNSTNAIILAGGNLNIRASSVSNQNTKPANSIITSGIISSYGAVNIFTDSLNNNSGMIAGKSTSVSALNNSSVNLYNTLGSFISTASVSLNLGNIDYTITGTVTANNVDITANNITNQGSVTASDFIKLNATGNSGASGSGNVTNGFASGNNSGDNSNVQLAAGTYVNLVAKNNINNYGTISATTDLTLTSTLGNIDNYSTGKITGGSGTTTINATNGSFNNASQTSLFTANNDAIFNIKDLNNTGEISIANDLTTNISNNLTNNQTALLWSGNNATFNVANTFLNNQADIYADRNLTIQKNSSADASQNKTNLVQNISGNIETYSGDISIKAGAFENKRSYMPTQGGEVEYRKISWDARHGNHTTIWYRAQMQGDIAPEAKIGAGNNLNISTASILNSSSSILANNNIKISSNLINNNSSSYSDYVAVRHWDHNYHGEYTTGDTCVDIKSEICNDVRGYWLDGTKDGYVNQMHYYLASIKSGGSLTITQNGAANSSLINGSNVAQYVASGANSKQSQNTSINKVDSYQLAQTGLLEIDLSSIISAINNGGDSKNAPNINNSNARSAPINKEVQPHKMAQKDNIAALNSTSETLAPLVQNLDIASSKKTKSGANSNVKFSGNFKINLDPAATTPLVETRSQFTDFSKFFGSSYYFDQLGLNGAAVLADLDRQTRGNNTRILGDSAVETKLIIDQLKNLTNDSLFLSKNINDPNQQIKELLDNSVNQFAALGLKAQDVALRGLSKEQVKSLTKDIVTFEVTTVNGISVLAPKVYLSDATLNRLLGNDSSVASLASSSTIFANSNLTIDAQNANLQNSGTIISGGDLAINVASLTNKTNSLAKAQIIAANNLSITANTGDIKNIGAKIESLGALNITALNGSILNTAIVQTNDKNLLAQNSESYQLKLGDNARSSGNITSTLLQNASIKGGSVSINAANDFTNLAASISTAKNTLADGSTTSGNLSISAGDDIKIATLELRNRTETRWGSGKKGGMSISDKTSNLSSDIDASGSLTLFASGTGTDSENSGKLQGSNIQITGSNLSASNGITLAAQDDVNIEAAQNTSYEESKSWKKGLTFSKSSVSGSQSTTNVLSNLTSDSGNISITSGSDTNLIGAKLKAEDVAIKAKTITVNNFALIKSGGDLNINATNNINLKNTLINSAAKTKITAGGDITLKNDSNFITSFATAQNTALAIGTSSIKDDAISSRSAAIFNAGTDIEINSGSNINISNNYFQSGGSIFMTATNNINNSNYQIKADENVVLTAGNDINNITNSTTSSDATSNPTSIEAGKMVSLDAGNDINNIGAIIKGGELVYLTAANDIVNKAAINYSINGTNLTPTFNGDANSYLISLTNTEETVTNASSGNIKSSLVAQGNITAGSTTINSDGSTTNTAGNVVIVAGNDINNQGSKITSTGSTLLEATDGDINITTAQLRDRTKTSWGSRKKGGTSTTDNTTNLESEITSGDNLYITAASSSSTDAGDINIKGSKLTSANNTEITAENDVNIAAAINSSYSLSTSSKKGFGYFSSSTNSKQTTTNIKSEIESTSGDIKISSGADTTITASDLTAKGSGEITAENLNILNGLDTAKTFSQKIKSSIGFNFKDALLASALVASAVATGGASLGAIGAAGVGSAAIGGTGNKKNSKTISTYTETVIGSNLTFGEGLNLTSSEDTTIRSSKLTAGTEGISGAQDLKITANNLYLLTASNSDYTSTSTKEQSRYFFENKDQGNYNTTAVNNELTSGTDGNINFNIEGQTLAQYNSKDWSNANASAPSDLNYLNDLKSKISSDQLTLSAVSDTNLNWNEKSAGLTQTGQITIAVAGAIATAGAGSFATWGVAAASSGAGSAATIATTSAVNASVNTDGNLLNNLDDIGKTTWKETTSKESLQTIAISAAIAAAAYGAGQWMKSKGVNPSLESGTMENSKVGVNVERGADGNWYQQLPKGGKIEVSSFKAYTIGNQNPALQTLNTTPGAPSFANFHDAMNFVDGVNQVTIAPYYAISQCAAAPTLCAMLPDTFIKVGTWGQVDTNLDIYKNDYGQQSN